MKVVVEVLARQIAMFHGSQIVARTDDGTMTIAALAGFGSWGHSASKYSEAKWREYMGAARYMAELIHKASPRPQSQKRIKAKRGRRHAHGSKP